MNGRRLHLAALLAISAGALSLLGACSLLPSEPYREVRSYDLGVPPSAEPAAALSVEPFSADSACKFKMLYRAEGNEMLIDEYNRWTQPPGQMLTKYLRLAFRDLPGASTARPELPKYEVSGSILAFEADLDSKKVNLGVHYILSNRIVSDISVERTMIFSQPMEGVSSSDVANSMSKAASQFVDSLKSDLQALEKIASEKNKAVSAKQ